MIEISVFGLEDHVCIFCKKKNIIGHILFDIENVDQNENKKVIFVCDKCFCKRQKQKMSKNGT